MDSHNRKLDFLGLVGLQAINGLVPLILFPYLIKTISSDEYALIALSESISLISLIFVLYGFELTSLGKSRMYKKISRIKTSVIFFYTLYSRILIWLAITVTLVVILVALREFELVILVLGWMLIPLSQALFSSYFALATGTNFYLFATVSASKILGFVGAVVSVNQNIDYVYIPFFVSMPSLLFSLVYCLFLIRRFNMTYVSFQVWSLMRFIKRSFPTFSNIMSFSTIKEFNVATVAISSNNAEVIAVFSLLDKLLRGASALLRPVMQFFAPKMIDIMSVDRFWFLGKTYRGIVLVALVLVLIGGLLTLYFPLEVFFGLSMVEKYDLNLVLTIMVVSLFFGFCSYYFLIRSALVPIRYFSTAVAIIGTLGIGVLYVSERTFGLKGAAIAILLPQVTIFIYLYLAEYVRNKV